MWLMLFSCTNFRQAQKSLFFGLDDTWFCRYWTNNFLDTDFKRKHFYL